MVVSYVAGHLNIERPSTYSATAKSSESSKPNNLAPSLLNAISNVIVGESLRLSRSSAVSP